MKKVLLAILAVMIFLPAFANKKTDKETLVWRYEVQDLNKVAKDGKSVIFKIWTYAKKDNQALNQAGKNAVHAVIFKQIGYNPALAGTSNIETEYKDEIKQFFKDGGEYMRFVQFVNNGAVAPADKIKLQKEWKIGVTVSVNRADLRKYLEEKGWLKAMNSMF
ncbi:MAG: hypothetical protein J5612_05895 [Paludibacteraceae bacterium]|nr:hypothetical protein [Paludibacteraceae bacterium]